MSWIQVGGRVKKDRSYRGPDLGDVLISRLSRHLFQTGLDLLVGQAKRRTLKDVKGSGAKVFGATIPDDLGNQVQRISFLLQKDSGVGFAQELNGKIS